MMYLIGSLLRARYSEDRMQIISSFVKRRDHLRTNVVHVHSCNAQTLVFVDRVLSEAQTLSYEHHVIRQLSLQLERTRQYPMTSTSMSPEPWQMRRR